MYFNGYRIIVSRPYRTFKSVKAKTKRKVGPKGMRTIMIKHHTGWAEVIEDGQMVVDEINKVVAANVRTVEKIKQVLEDDAKRSNSPVYGRPPGFM